MEGVKTQRTRAQFCLLLLVAHAARAIAALGRRASSCVRGPAARTLRRGQAARARLPVLRLLSVLRLLRVLLSAGTRLSALPLRHAVVTHASCVRLVKVI